MAKKGTPKQPAERVARSTEQSSLFGDLAPSVLVMVTISGLAFVLAVPHAVVPTEVPVPVAKPTALEQQKNQDHELSTWLRNQPESQKSTELYEVRLVGEKLRAYGRFDAAEERDPSAIATARSEVLQAVAVAFKQGPRPLQALRASMAERFVEELSRWEITQKPTPELAELGGDIVGLIQRSGWVNPNHQVSLDETSRIALFKRRFNEVAALKDPSFALSIDEQRALSAFFLTHPPVALQKGPNRSQYWAWIAKKVDEIAAVDPTYPAHLARGIVFCNLTDPVSSSLSFEKYIHEHPDGPWSVRARNYLAACK